MRPLPVILCCILVTGGATAFKKCNNCVKITECAPASELLRTDRSPAAIKLFQDAHCGFEGVPKVCCINFFSSRFGPNDENGDSAQTTEVEIENHHNIRLLPTECGDIEGNRIVGGMKAGLYEFPWMALISYKEGGSLKFKCGGTVITARYVLTAAHCIDNGQVFAVRIGEYDISQPVDCVGEDEIRECVEHYQDIPISHKIQHPRYSKSQGRVVNDIGLLRLARSVDFSYNNSGTICLPIMKNLRDTDVRGKQGIVAGWGLTETRLESNTLLKVLVPIYSQNYCHTFYNRLTEKELQSTMCAGTTKKDSCKGDSGGPLMLDGYYNDMYKYIQFGVVSFGIDSCGTKPGLYTDVRKYLNWILDTIKP